MDQGTHNGAAAADISDDEIEGGVHLKRSAWAASKSPRNSLASSFSQSMRMLEETALIAAEDHSRSISGRLGRRIESVRSPPGTPMTGTISEESQLLPKDGLKAPALLVWIFPALACASAYAFYNVFIKKGSASIHPILGGVILQFVAAILGTILLVVLTVHQKAQGVGAVIEYDRHGILWSVFAGLAVGTAEMLSFCVSGMSVPASQSIPIIIGGSVCIGAVLGLVLLGEQMMMHGWSGVLMLCIGIGMVATDPGDKVEEGPVSSDEDVVGEAPAVLIWIAPALICASAYAFYNIFIKKGSASINPILGGVILQFVAAVFGSILLGFVMLQGKELEYDSFGILWACMAGISVGTAEMLSFVVSGMGVPASQAIPVIIGGSVMVGAILGLVMLGESMMLQGWLGVLLLMTGIGFVATDPAACTQRVKEYDVSAKDLEEEGMKDATSGEEHSY